MTTKPQLATVPRPHAYQPAQATHEPRLARVAALVADPARSRMLAYLLSGEYASAGELARSASVTPATASGHLRQLLDAEFLVCEPRGRHRYYRLANAEVAHALEALAVVAERGSHDKQWAHPQRTHLRQGRCCYDHLAGRLGVMLCDALLRDERLVPAGASGFALTATGQQWLAELGFHTAPPSSNRRYAYRCLDWSERRDHLAGQLAQQLLEHFKQNGWLRPGQGRALELTATGLQRLLPALQASAPL
jgi:DNA-binding transcriptional ArsR family regulator